MSDDYRIVSVKLKGVRQNSIFVEHPRQQRDVSIPRSLLHAGDDLRIGRLDFGDVGHEITFRMREWKAEELGL